MKRPNPDKLVDTEGIPITVHSAVQKIIRFKVFSFCIMFKITLLLLARLFFFLFYPVNKVTSYRSWLALCFEPKRLEVKSDDWLLDCEKSLFCSKFRGSKRKKHNTSEQSWACESNIRSRELQVPRTSEDEQKEIARLSPRYSRLRYSLRMSSLDTHALSCLAFFRTDFRANAGLFAD